MVDTITELGNPFSDESKELVSLVSNIVAVVSVVKTVGAVKETGLQQPAFLLFLMVTDYEQALKNCEEITCEPDVSVLVIDDTAVVQMLKTGTTKTFKKYSKAVFEPYTARWLGKVKRVDVCRLVVEELWIACGSGNNFRYLSVHLYASAMGQEKARALLMFQAITGCDAIFFCGRGKQAAWDA
ncbi:hypothetical protein Hamer_G005568 [Homarus americanus]|uniref:Uncharacterized protein n=1 Tax=Homarus americanus TaxID=6706 RepID=A0A8J5MWQ9_HOMAM|nr:hypothetical protein Hamer_G005568 [Homarus americanus]